MYGLVNFGIKKMVNDEFGSNVWKMIENKSEIKNEFSKMEYYSDDSTYKLAVAAAEVLEIDLSDVLKTYGKWWIKFAEQEFPQLLEAGEMI